MTNTTKTRKVLINRWLLKIALLIIIGLPITTRGQTITTPYTGSFTFFAASANIAFVIDNTNGAAIILNDLGQYMETAENNSIWQLYYSTTSLSGSSTVPGAGWTLLATSAAVPVPANGIKTAFTGLGFSIPASTQIRFVMRGTGPGSVRYVLTPTPAGDIFSAGGVNLKVGTQTIAGSNVGYSGSGTTLSTTPRYWHGSISFAPSGPCTSPPTPGTSTATPSSGICIGSNIGLGLSGASGGSGQTYQWQESTLIGGPYTNLGSSSSSPSLNTPATSTKYYRCEVTCSGNTQTSTPVLVTVNPSFPAGTYTINSAVATGGTNFQTFNAFVSALSCGISGPVVVNVAPGSGPYSEQVIVPQVLNMSSTNTVTINGNGTTLTFAASVSTAPSTLELNGSDFFIVNNLNITGTGATYAFAAHLWNDANNNQFNNCVFTSPNNSSTSTLVPFSISGSVSSASTSGASGINNVITGCTMNAGYYGAALTGNSASPATGNKIVNCQINDSYIYCIYLTYQNGTEIKGNTIERPTRTTFTTFYGVYMTTGTTNLLVHANRIKNPMAATPTTTTAAYGIYAVVSSTVGNENKVFNNIVYDFKTNGAQWGIYLYGYYHCYHNTVSFDYATSTAGETRGIYVVSGGTGTIIRNNVVSITRAGTGIKHCLYFAVAPTTSDNNVLYINAPAGTNYTGFLTSSYATITNWQAGTIYDDNSQAVNPTFSAPASGNFTPTNIAVDNLGTPVGITTDILNTARSLTTPDVGAYEFTVSAGLDIGAFDLITPATSGCYSDVQTVTIQIKNYGGAADFSVTPATVTCNITGTTTATLTGTLTGTLAVNGTMNVTLSGTFDMSVNGSYTFNAFTTAASDGNSANNAMTAQSRTRAAVLAGTVSSLPSSICVSGAPVLSVAGSANGNIQWQESNVSTSGPWTNVSGTTTYSPGTISQTMYYQAITSCLAASATSNVVTVAVNTPSITGTNSPQNLCGTGTVTFNATGSSGTALNWYTAATGGSPVATGTSYTTPVISSTTPYYVSAVVGSTPFNVTLGAQTTTTQAGMPFRAGNATAFRTQYLYTAAELTTAGISAGTWDQFKWTVTTAIGAGSTMGNLTIRVGHTGVSALTATFQASPSTIVYGPFNYVASASLGDISFPFTTPFTWDGSSNVLIEICHDNPAPTGVSGQVAANTTAFVSVAAVGNVCGTAAGATTQSIRPIIKISGGSGCESPRTTVTANVVSAPSISASTTQSLVCSGGSTTLNVSSSNPGYSYTWTPGNLTGTSVNVNPASTITYTVTSLDNSGGAFDGCTNLSTVVINAQPASVVATASPSGICGTSGSTVVSLTPSSGYGAGTIQWQSAPSVGGPFTNISGATSNSYSSGTLTSDTYFKAVISDGSSNVCLEPIASVIIGVPSVSSTTPGTRCGTGTVSLGAAVSAGATAKWYTTLTGGAPIGSGSPFTTPVISSNTTYYVGAESGAAPFDLTVGTQTTTTQAGMPFRAGNGTAFRTQFLFTASELTAAGLAAGTWNQLKWTITTAVGGATNLGNFTMRIGNSAASVMTTTFLASPSLVVYGPLTYTPPTTVGDVSFNLTSAYTWDGISNVLIEICHDIPSVSVGSGQMAANTNSFVSVTATGGVCGTATGTTQSIRPIIKIAGGTGCASSRTPVTATVTPAPAITASTNTSAICPGGTADISVTSGNDPDYSYSWTSSPAGFTATGAGPHTVSPSVTTKYYVSATDISGGANQGCTALDSITIVNGGALVAGAVSSSQSQLCVTGSVTLTLTGASGGTNQWQMSTVSASGPWNNVGTGTNSYNTGTITQTGYYQVVTSCNTSSVTSNVLTVIVNNPQLLSTTPTSRCGYGSVSLGASVSSGSTANWYANATGGLPLSTGITFNTPNINNNTTYYVAAASGGGGSVTTGMANALATATSGAGTTNFGLVFDVFSAVTINSVTVYPVSATSASGTVTIDIINSSGTVLNTATFSVTGSPGGITPYVANVNFIVSPGTNLKMRPGFTGITGLLFEPAASAPSGNYGYPYVVPGVLSINTSTLTAAPTNTARNDLYYYFYNWQLSTGCEGSRVPVIATVSTSEPIVVTSDFPAVCTGGSTNLSVSSNIDPDYSYVWTSSPSGFNQTGAGPFTASPAVTTTYYVLATNVSGGPDNGCTHLDSVTVVSGGGTLASGTMSANLDNHCVSGNSSLTLAGASGGAIQWQRSFVSSSGPWTNIQLNGTTYNTGALTQTAYYQAVVSCQTSSLTSNVQTVTVNNPQLSSTSGATRCGPGSVSLNATPASGTVNWYTVASGGTAIATGNTYSPTVTGTTTYYAAASFGGGFSSLGLPNRVGSTTNSGYSDVGLMFNATQGFTLQSVAIYPVATTPSGNVTATIALKNSSGTVLQSTTVSVPTSVSPGVKTLIPLNFVVPVGTGHRLVFTSATGGGITGFIREVTTGFTYPYTLAGYASITSAYTGGASSAYYYYFYDWQVVTGCEGSRIPVVATVTPSPAVTVSVQHPTICTGQSATLSVSSSNPGYSYTWNPGGLTGASVTVTPSSNTTYTLSAIDVSGGVYDQCAATGTAAVNKSAGLPPDLSTSGGGVACEGNGISLSVSNNAPGQVSGNSYAWTTDAAIPFTSTQQTPNVTGSSVAGHSGNYTVVVTNSFLCTSSAIEVVTVNPSPTLSIVSTQNVGCVGGSDGSITVGATGGLANYDFTSDFVNFVNDPAQATITNLPTGPTTIFVSDANGCNSQISASLTAISSTPPSAAVVVPFIGMPTNVCNGTTATLSIPAVSNTTMYIWDAPGAAYFNGNPLNVSPFTTSTPSVTVTYSTPGGSLYVTGVQAANGCGASLRKVQKTRGTISVPAIVSGSTTACANTTGTYSTGAVDAASSYQWTITGDATVSGTGTTATVTFGPAWNGGTLCVAAKTSCYTSPTKCITIGTSASTLNAISGAFTACPNTTLSYSVPPSTGAASYTWTLPAGSTGSSTTNSISVTYGPGYSAAGSICVSVTSVCGVTSAIKCKTVAPGLPGQPSSITGALAGLCNQTVAYSCPSQGAGVTYNWTSPGSITSGQGSTSISTTFAALSTGNVCVTASNSCGSSLARCVPVKGAPNAPGAITATPSSWCANTPGIEFNVSTGSLTGSYTLSWAYPNASVVTYAFGGGNSTSLILDWISGSGAVNVTASNACGGATKPSTWSSTCREGETGTVSSMTVSPNPTTGVVNVNYTATKGSTVINVLDLAGRVVMTQATSSVEGVNTTQLDMSKLAKGAYMLSVQSTQGNKQIKVVVE